ncbi:hypothetical protein M8818_007468 [Zalaria obscura]|uniref:Uncharacterized protein n=1 Tax=Zalaria obscura TaxID=2024903 RepID=A0ACC3S668_9PEZI
MLRLYILSLLACCLTVSALPTPFASWFRAARWHAPSSTSYLEFVKRVPQAVSGSCDLSQASIPTGKPESTMPLSMPISDRCLAPTPLPPPSSGLSLSHVAVGRGTQNYTCDLTNATAVPVAIGALASLYNVSCIAADMPALLAYIPGIALDMPIPSSPDSSSPVNEDLSGFHYFLNSTTPFFNLDTSLHSYGNGAFKKANQTTAPTTAMKGPNGQGDGAVAWLKLSAMSPGGQVFQEVYRVNTAGGNPPKTCTGMAASFEVPYSAEYWLYT